MANPLKQFITRKLKENVPLSEIKKDLKEKGYGTDEINKAVREVIAGINKKLPTTTIFQLAVLIIGVVIAIGVAVYLLPSNITSLSVYPECNKFSTEITNCENAVRVALENFPGEVGSVDKDQVKVFLNVNESVFKEAWLVGVNLNSPLISDKGSVYNVRVAIDSGNGNYLLAIVG